MLLAATTFPGQAAVAQDGYCGVGFGSDGNTLTIQLTQLSTGKTYCGIGTKDQFNPFTLSDEYTFMAFSADGSMGISGTFDVTFLAMQAAQETGVWDLSNIDVTDSWGTDGWGPDGGGGGTPPWVDFPPDALEPDPFGEVVSYGDRPVPTTDARSAIALMLPFVLKFRGVVG